METIFGAFFWRLPISTLCTSKIQNVNCQCIIGFLLISIRTWGTFWIFFWQCGILINMFNPDCRLIIQLNLQPDAFALIHSLQIFSIWSFTIYNRLCTFSNRIYRFCVKKDGVVLVSKSAELSYGQNQCSGCAHEWGCVVQKKLWSNQWKRCWATASTAKSARIDLCNNFSKRAMHWLIYLMQLDCDDDKYEEE